MTTLSPHYVDKERFSRLLQGLKAAYTSPNFLPDREAVKVWYEMLKDIPYEVLSLAAQTHIAVSQYPPTIAELRSRSADILTADMKDWTEAWSHVLDAVGKYGLQNGREAIEQMDALTVEAVRRVGYWAICNSENIAVERASFRDAYNQIIAREKQSAVVPDRLKIGAEAERKKIEEKTQNNS